MSKKITGGQSLIHSLYSEGVKVIFGLAGVQMYHAIISILDYPEMKFIGLCHEISSMERQLPDILKTPFENIEYRAGGLNHFSILVEAKYKNFHHHFRLFFFLERDLLNF